ncbi:BBSome-interacting protein 1, partial [Sigmodon hispidus]
EVPPFPEFDSKEQKHCIQQSQMAEVKSMFREVLPKQGQLSMADVTTMVLCKPKLLLIKSLTLEKLEKMQQSSTRYNPPTRNGRKRRPANNPLSSTTLRGHLILPAQEQETILHL